MLAIRSTIMFIIICLGCSKVQAETKDLQNCETQLNKYRKFLLQAILSFEDVCDVHNSRNSPLADASFPPQVGLFGRYQPSEQKSEVWQFLKMVMGQLNDLDFANVIQDTVIEKCRLKLQLQTQQQRDEKRNAVVLGKKQRFHSWGGKRSGNELEQEHNDDAVLGY